ncbi:MAG: hypothetical protein SFX73_24810 [Kofleriaceae bacterium]|nr:hypothetical protein [Kofleriaceae bacterium]
MRFGSITRRGIVRTSLVGTLGGALFGAMFSSIAAGVIAAIVLALVTFDPRNGDDVPPTDGPRTLTIDLDRR